jgi:hypothetical protein
VDSFDASTGKVTSRDRDEVAAWFLDADYEGLVFRVSQAFFPRSNAWKPLQRALKGSIDRELMEQLESFVSLPSEAGEHAKAADAPAHRRPLSRPRSRGGLAAEERAGTGAERVGSPPPKPRPCKGS